MKRRILWIAAALLAFVPAVAGSARHEAASPSAEAMAGPYSVMLKVLPAESFAGSKPEMTWDGGAHPVELKGAEHPNHHMVAFVKRDGKPVTDADVDIRYRRTDSENASWHDLPVARMHVTDKGDETTHYGNNVDLAAGRYTVEVDVNGKPTTLQITLSS